MPQILCPVLMEIQKDYLERLVIFAVDERLVPIDSVESNTGTYLKQLPTLFKNNIVIVNCCINNGKFNNFNFLINFLAKATAINFERVLKSLNPPLSDDGFPQFDLLFLGIGQDGHTCSLFPGHDLLKVKFYFILSYFMIK